MLLIWMLIIPLLLAGVIGLVPWENRNVSRILGLIGALVPLIMGLELWRAYPAGKSGLLEGSLYQYQAAWFPEPLGANFHLAIDGISLVFLVLTALLVVLAVLFSWVHVRERERAYYVCMLLLLVPMMGVFMARDLLLFYLFWEVMLLPLYFVVGVWGGSRRLYASIKMVLYTLLGSLLMLVAVVVLHGLHMEQTGTASFAFQDLYALQLSPATAFWLFLAFALAFAIKTPLFPVHTWLPDAHVEAPSAGSVILAGIMLKVGIYGFIRLLVPLFPGQTLYWSGLISLLAVIGILYGGLVAWAQEDVKKLVAYSSVSHLGFVVLGIFSLSATSVTGGLLQGAVHGINTGALFLMVGMLYQRLHTREIEEITGVSREMPVYATFLVIFALASVGLPSTNGFIGEFLILVGSFPVFPYLTVLAAFGVIVAAIYMLTLLRECVFGEASASVRGTEDLNGIEVGLLVPLVLIVFWVGLYPSPVIERLEPTVQELLDESYAVSSGEFPTLDSETQVPESDTEEGSP